MNRLKICSWTVVLIAVVVSILPIKTTGEYRLIVQPLPVHIKVDNDAYTLHEWGVFSATRDAAWAKQDMLAEWQTFPAFFRGILPGRKLFQTGELVPQYEQLNVWKPVIFIHNEKMTSIDLKVTFPNGRPVVWWPPAIEPNSVRQSKTGNHLRFKFIAVGPQEQKSKVGAALMRVPLQKVASDHWLNELRKVKCSRVTVTGGVVPQSTKLGYADQFIYYDGIIPPPASPQVKRDGKSIVMTWQSDHDWHDVMIIEQLNGRVRIAEWIDKLDAGKNERTIELTDVTDTKAKALGQLQAQLLARITAAGLNSDEAASMVNVWKKGLFERDGLQLFYRLPQKTYDKWLPLTINPKPAKTVRVGLVLHAHLEPELETRVKQLIAELASEEFPTRAKAEHELIRIGGAAFKWIEAAADSDDAEVAMRCERILRYSDASKFAPAKAQVPVSIDE